MKTTREREGGRGWKRVQKKKKKKNKEKIGIDKE